MRDGVIKEDGTSRLVRGNFPATYDELRALAAAGTLPLDLLFNGTGWAVQPTFLNKGALLSAATEAALGFTNSQVDYTVDDALSWIWRAVIGDRGAIVVRVTTPDGTPAVGVYIGLDSTPDPNTDISTNANGEALLFADLGAHTVNLLYPLGYTGTASVSVNIDSVGSLAFARVDDVEDDSDGIWTITQTGSYYIRPDIPLVDIFLCGGGGSGGLIALTSDQFDQVTSNAAGGGGGGHVKNQFSVPNDGSPISVTVGAGAVPAQVSGGSEEYWGNSGGTTSVSIGAQTFSAPGGEGGRANYASPPEVAPGGSGGSGGGGGDAEYAYTAGNGGSDGSDGSGLSGSAATNNGKGDGVTTRPFQEPSLPPCCAGGGGLAVWIREGPDGVTRTATSKGTGGNQGGGNGGMRTLHDAVDATYYGSAGGGTYGNKTAAPADCRSGAGYQGVVMIRRHVG